jgi:hypothetical protein
LTLAQFLQLKIGERKENIFLQEFPNIIECKMLFFAMQGKNIFQFQLWAPFNPSDVVG